MILQDTNVQPSVIDKNIEPTWQSSQMIDFEEEN